MVVTGLSMGGHGALYLSNKHPELLQQEALSGAVDINSIFMLNPEGIERTKTLFGPILGDKLHLSCVQKICSC
jgi:S-formylglutathione hydrolase FrmB